MSVKRVFLKDNGVNVSSGDTNRINSYKAVTLNGSVSYYDGATYAGINCYTPSHGYPVDSYVEIRGTTSYNGIYKIKVLDTNNFIIRGTYGSSESGSSYNVGYLNSTTGVWSIPLSTSDSDKEWRVSACAETGENVVSNGSDWTGATGSTPPTGWTAVGSPTFSLSGGVLTITKVGTTQAKIKQTLTVSEDEVYILYARPTGGSAPLQVNAGSTDGGTEYGSLSIAQGQPVMLEIEPTGTSLYLEIVTNNSTNNGTLLIDSVSVTSIGLSSAASREIKLRSNDTAKPVIQNGSQGAIGEIVTSQDDATIYCKLTLDGFTDPNTGSYVGADKRSVSKFLIHHDVDGSSYADYEIDYASLNITTSTSVLANNTTIYGTKDLLNLTRNAVHKFTLTWLDAAGGRVDCETPLQLTISDTAPSIPAIVTPYNYQVFNSASVTITGTCDTD